MTTTGGLLDPALKPGPPALTSDAAVREALARYLAAVTERLHAPGTA